MRSRFCERARSLRPDIVFGADLIAGFPTETDDMFENSHKHRRCVRLDLPARFSVLSAAGHAGGAHAAGAGRRRQGACGPAPRKGQRVLAMYLNSQRGQSSTCSLKATARAARRSSRKLRLKALPASSARRGRTGACDERRADTVDRRGLRVSEPRGKGKGIFGRLLAGSPTASDRRNEAGHRRPAKRR